MRGDGGGNGEEEPQEREKREKKRRGEKRGKELRMSLCQHRHDLVEDVLAGWRSQMTQKERDLPKKQLGLKERILVF